MHIDPPRRPDAARWGKRLFDVVGSIVLIGVQPAGSLSPRAA